MASTRPIQWEDDDLDDDDFQIRGHTLLYVIVFFSIILVLASFFYLCTRSRWAIAVRSSSGNPSLSVSSVITSSSQPRGLDADTINSLPITIHQVGDDHDQSTTECSICLGVFEQMEKVKVLPSCSHCYHCECVDKWLITHSSCPICRTSVLIDHSV